MPNPASSPHRAGFVALVGRPSAGKSTLLNALLGQKIAIVSNKPQTTRSRILGVSTGEGYQLALVDTPGLHEKSRGLSAALNDAAETAAKELGFKETIAAVREQVAR